MKRKNSLLLLSAATLLFSFSILKSQDIQYPAFLAKSNGSIALQTENSQLWFKAKQGMGLKNGDTIKTGEKSYATIFLEDGSTFRIEENSTIKIQSLAINASKKKCNAMMNILKRGYVLFFADKNYRPDIKLNTPVCTIAIRGTGLAVNVPDEKTTQIAMFEGKVIVKDFVEESGLPQKGGELLLAFLHEMALKSNQEVAVTAEGIAQPRKLKQTDMADTKEKYKEIKELSAEIQKENAKTKTEERQSQRGKLREEALSNNEKDK